MHQILTLLLAIGIAGASSWSLICTGGGPETTLPASTTTLARGKQVYRVACAPCHGLSGTGHGPLSGNMRTRPRDFTKAVYKSRSTASGQLPTDEDLERSMQIGAHSSTMPPFDDMATSDRKAVVQYIKTFSPRFADSTEYPLEVLTFGPAVLPTSQSITRGRAVYLEMKCEPCHGAEGNGDGPSAEMQHDDFGDYVHTPNLANASDLKFSTSPQDVYRIFSTGMNGVAMPSYAGILPDTDRWNLANYVWSLGHRE